MTDYDRGAYTPQTDAPLAFDPRRPSERRPVPMALIGSAAVLVILLAGVAMVYRGGVRHAGESPRPVGEPVMAVKTAPPPALAGASGAPATQDVYSETQGANTIASAVGAPSKTPTFAPPAEQPAARPAPSADTVALLAKPAAPTHIERPPTPSEIAAASSTSEAKPAAASHARARPDASELAAAGATRTTADAATADAPETPVLRKPKPLASQASPAVGSALASAPGKAVVQIGAFSSSALADKGYADVSAALPEQMAGKAKHVQPLDKDGTTLYRTWLSGFATRADAQAFCEALKAKGMSCLVKG